MSVKGTKGKLQVSYTLYFRTDRPTECVCPH